MKKSVIFTVLLLFITNSVNKADEGMWMLTQLKQLDLNKKGLEIPVEEIYSPDKPCIANAIISLEGGTASFISSEGLIITNHHVAYDALQRASNVDSNYLEDGFLAKNKSEEIAAPGYRAKVVIEMKDVTNEVLKVIKGVKDAIEKDKRINQYIATVTDAVKAKYPDQEAEIVGMFEGRQYIMYTYQVFKDVRIVYAPPISIGKFGGEIDNWMWPRHTGDFSFLRVYVSPDGKGNEYNEKNIPFKPKYWIKIAQGDIKEGDFNFVVGFPGFTTRYRTSNSVRWNYNITYPFLIKNLREIIDLSNDLTRNDPEGKLKMAGQVARYSNAEKKFRGVVDGMKKTNFLQKKLAFEQEFLNWANSSPELKSKYSNIIEKEKKQYDIKEKTRERDKISILFEGMSGTLVPVANKLYFLARELEKPEKERQPGISKTSLTDFEEELKYIYNNYYEPFDKVVLLKILKMADSLPVDQRITQFDNILKNSQNSIEKWVEEAYSTTKMKDIEFVKSLLGKSSKEIEKTGDPIFKLAISYYPISEEYTKSENSFYANVTEARKEYLNALYTWKGSTLYPDANSTIRFTWGAIKGYRPADAVWYMPFTTLQGVIDKNTGKEPFNVPQNLVMLKEKNDLGAWVDPELKDVPVAFLNQCDITGGNSGSPILNSKGEIVGVAFDGNYESMISDWNYDYNLQRSLNVDIRYVLFITEKFAKASFLLDELGVTKK